MGGGNGAKSAAKREAAQKKAASGQANSQLKANEAAKSIQCVTCKQTFMITTKAPELISHADNKHKGATIEQCFPGFVEVASKKK